MTSLSPRILAPIILAMCSLQPACGGPLDEAPAKAKGFLQKLRPKKPSRPCFDHEECFAGEYCAEGTCRPYQGRTVGRPVDRPDLSAYIYDLGAPDMGGD